MNKEEAIQRIKEDFMNRYYTWMKDYEEMPEKDYARKYGWYKGEAGKKDNLKNVASFQKYIFQGRYIGGWVKEGYSREIIWELHRDGFLSYDYCTSYQARVTGRADFYYISQKTAKEIYKEYKQKGGNAA